MFSATWSGLAGAALAVAALLWLSASVTSLQSCDFSVATAQCAGAVGRKGGLSNAKNVSKSVTVGPCSLNALLAGAELLALGSKSPAQFGLETNGAPFSQCLSKGCASGQCLKVTEDCSAGAEPELECVPPAATVDIRPLAPFLYIPMAVLGAVLFLGVFLLEDRRLVLALLVVCVGTHWVESSIEVQRGCDYSIGTAPCGTAGASSKSVQVFADSSFGISGVPGLDVTLPPHIGPFATNYPRSSTALSLGCDVGQCVKVTTDCTSMESTGECVAGGSSAFTKPVDLFFGIAIVVFGVVIVAVSKLFGAPAGSGGSGFDERAGLLQSPI